MKNNLKKYNEKRNFNKTKEPVGEKKKSNKKLRFVVQHHLARKDHYDLRLEWKGVLKSWAVPKGPSYNPDDKRLAVLVEDHPLSYRNFEGTIPKGEYGGGTVMLFDEGYYELLNNFEKDFKNGIIKFKLAGKRLKGLWSLVHFKEDNWLLIKDEDEFYEYKDIKKIKNSIRTDRTMEEIEKGIKKKKLKKIEISSPDKLIDKNTKKIDIVNYYEKVANRMLPYLENRIISVVRFPDGIKGTTFFKKHLEPNRDGLKLINVINKDGEKEEYYYITDINGIINEVQMNTIEFHTWGSNVKRIEKPNIMVFDLDPDEKLSLKKLREGVKDLKSILDELNLKSYLKTSGGKGYHILVPMKEVNWKKFRSVAKNIAMLMESKWPDKYTSNIRKNKRKNKIFIDWVRNTRGSTSVAPYSLRARKNLPVSMPIKWSEIDKIKPNEINMKEAIRRLSLKDPWIDFFDNL